VRECDAVAQIYAAQVAGAAEYAGDITALPPTILGGVNASAPHILWGERRFGRDETVAIELAGACRHYTAGLARTIQLGLPDKRVVELSSVVLEGMEGVLGAIKPGTTASAVEAAWRAVISRHGLIKKSRIGYSIGIGYPPDWGEHTISLRAGDPSILEAGNVLHAILGMWMEEWGVEVSETVLVTERACETLTRFPRELHRK
jgi:Xaa-Pro dipeptidase